MGLSKDPRGGARGVQAREDGLSMLRGLSIKGAHLPKVNMFGSLLGNIVDNGSRPWLAQRQWENFVRGHYHHHHG